MKFTFAALTLLVAAVGFSGTASAQLRITPVGKLFFEGDIVKHVMMDQQGPFCVLQSQFKHGEGVAWRIRAVLPNGVVADDKVLKSVEVELGDGQKLPAKWGGHGNPPTDYFWTLHWIIPAGYPTGSLGYKVHATMMDDSVVTWEPFTRAASQLTIVAGDVAMAAPKP